MQPHLRIDDAQFQRLMNKYSVAAGRDVAHSLNVKSYFIVKKAMRLTRKADKGKIHRHLTWNRKSEDRLRAWALKRAPDLKTDKERKKYFTKMRGARKRAVGYLRAGWLPALRAFGRRTKQARKMQGVVSRGIPKGKGLWAKDGFSPRALFINSTGYTGHQATALRRYGEPALARAWQHEARSMKRYMERKAQKTAKAKGMA